MNKPITIKLPATKPRNPLAPLGRSKRAGVHQRTEKAERLIAKRQLKKSLKGLDEG